ncbi:gliding motility-associated C-terminal domain-containing protein [Nonlabens sp. Hel1_33_55]|uniref:T9SS type B sorting domain-containing protein n=1 Tax=Nonlabens sp. Hel1_33_55 TaxID=1336802 RepID=UPI000875DAF0|nr:T9SS type B sorting domain-containing protein [Nonlabens sp. Hel1_33_55]SCY04666.1 gliding motility-associated C-terminal domain-containing protein [Nonlabens sp. Hel1_33_55]
MKKLLFVVVMVASFAFAKAQLGFCSGASGEAIFTETFGRGINSGPPLNAMQTNYTFVNSGTQDGQYTISNNLEQFVGTFHNTPDHTGDVNGKALIINASFAADQFYQTSINNLCENTNYEFSAWIINLYNPSSGFCSGREIPIQVRFEIWDATDTNRLADGIMNPRFGENQPTWIQYALTFTTAAGQNGCILKMINEGDGGCGNDLAIDDIVFRTCGDVVQLEDSNNDVEASRCVNDASESITLTVNTSESIYDTPEYQWQSSTDGTNFTDITGENGNSFTSPTITNTTFYRVKIAEDAVNLSGSECANFSGIFEYRVVDAPAATAVDDDVSVCTGEQGTLEVRVANGFVIDWFDAPTGGNALVTASNSIQVTQSGTYYAETRDTDSGCTSADRVAIEFTVSDPPLLNGQDFVICPNENVLLDPQASDTFSYEWSTGEMTPTIEVNTAGTYTCVVTNTDGCSATTSFNVSTIDAPLIIELQENADVLTVITNDGNFQYRINGGDYQLSNRLDINGILQAVVEVTDLENCTTVTETFNRLGITQFFTPNGDGFNDVWEVGNLAAFPGARVELYDRYGKLLKVMDEADPNWNGIFNNEPLPSSDYWYRVTYEDVEIKGHFSLKR